MIKKMSKAFYQSIDGDKEQLVTIGTVFFIHAFIMFTFWLF